MEGLQMMREEYEVGNQGITIATQVRRLANPRANRERKQNREIAASCVVLVVNGSNVPKDLVKRGIEAAGVR